MKKYIVKTMDDDIFGVYDNINNELKLKLNYRDKAELIADILNYDFKMKFVELEIELAKAQINMSNYIGEKYCILKGHLKVDTIDELEKMGYKISLENGDDEECAYPNTTVVDFEKIRNENLIKNTVTNDMLKRIGYVKREDGYIFSTIKTYDYTSEYITIIGILNKNDNFYSWKIAEKYYTREEAIKGHKKYVNMTADEINNIKFIG